MILLNRIDQHLDIFDRDASQDDRAPTAVSEDHVARAVFVIETFDVFQDISRFWSTEGGRGLA
jgi:hypothetical protein